MRRRDDAAAAAAREIAEIWRAYTRAHDRGDAEEVARWFTDDALVLAPGLPEVRGREGFRELVAQSFETARFDGLEIESVELEVRGDAAWELARFSETMRIEGREPRHLRGRFMVRWARRPDGWRIHRYISNAGPTEERAAPRE